MNTIKRLIAWWRRPPLRERVLATMVAVHYEGTREMRGLDIAKRANCRGTVYVALRQLEDEGLVGSREEPELTLFVGERELRRRVYWLTMAGQQAANGARAA
jgi:DNA-binding PadR family transcriptional regulator